MRTLLLRLLACTWLLLGALPASAQNNWTTPGGSGVNGTVGMCLNASGQAVVCSDATALPSFGTISPLPKTTTTVNSTIAVTNTFQAALAASSTRKSCLLQNTGTHVEYVYFGAIGSATTSNAFQINPGQTISCATVNGLVLTDAVNITGTAGDGYIVTSQ